MLKCTYDRALETSDEHLVWLINDEEEGYFELLLQGADMGNYEVVGKKNNVLGVCDDCELITHSQRPESFDHCKVFHPDNALRVEEADET